MTIPVLFEFEALPVRVMTGEDGEYWFCAKDVCAVLGYTNSRQSTADHCREKGVSKRYTLTEQGKQELQFIDEGNLYRLIIRSRREEAKRFESWVCDEVLPMLRKTGGYQLGSRSTAATRIAHHRLRLALGKELYRTADPGLRTLIHQQLADVSNALGLPTPEIDTLGRMAHVAPEILKSFWEALAYLDGIGVDYNHASRSNVLAVNLPELARLLMENGLSLRFDTTLREAMWKSRSPRCLHKNIAVHSRLTGATIKCWVFERLTE
ncbi:BRO-N domain-containing protein [Pseudomonas ceruminis]|uniref:BRO-N domain-containing protein n=1 Tax=Pseudomonas ceruminis TaxID=2740516 RepID=UPI0040469A9A